MQLIADGGSTKADWALLHEDGTIEFFSSEGFNPNQHDASAIAARLKMSNRIVAIADKISAVHYFGSGCSSAASNAIVESGVGLLFRNARIFVDHDVQAAAIAACGKREGIACILGTGSNACYFDGQRAHPARSGLGYILGDEGSGTWFGKRLLTRYLYGLQPKELAKAFGETYGVTREEAIRRVYRESGANNWLASFAPFLSEHHGHEWIQQTLRAGFTEFFELCVRPIMPPAPLQVHFVGSIAFSFEESLRASGKMMGFDVGHVVQKPIEGLAKHFRLQG